MQNKSIQKLVLENIRLSHCGIDLDLNSIVDTFYQKPQLLGPEEEPTLQQKSAMEVLKQLWENKHFGGSVFEPVKSAGMPSIARQGASAPIKNAGLHDRANGLLAGFRSGGWDPQYKFLTLKGVQVSRSQGASGKLVDIQILCTDIEAL